MLTFKPSAYRARRVRAASLLLALLLAACGDDPEVAGGDPVPSPDRCAPGAALEPLLSPKVTITTRTRGLCALCIASDKENVIDEDLTNFASLNTAVGVLGNLEMSVASTTGPIAGDRRVGFVVTNGGATIPLTLSVIQTTRVTTLLNGQEQESASPSDSNNPLVLSAIGLLGESPDASRFIGFVATKEFDELRLNFGGALNVLNGVHVFAACVGNN